MTTHWTLVTPSNINVQHVNAFLALELAGGLGLSLVVLTALASRHVTRNSTWYSFLISWIVSCIAYVFTFILGEQTKPTYGPCLVQAAGIYSVPALTSLATLAFGIDMLLGVRAAAGQQPPKRRHWITLMLVVVPYVTWLALFVGILMFGISRPSLVKMGPNGTYCDYNSDTPSKISSLFAISGTLFLLVIEVYIAVRLIKQRKVHQDRQLAAMAVRIIIFSVLGAMGLGIGVAYVLYSLPGAPSDIVMATLPVGGFLIFGTQMDLVNVWLFWRPRPIPLPADGGVLKSPSIPEVPTPVLGP